MSGARPKALRFAIVASYAPSLIVFREALIRDALALGHSVLCVAPDFTDALRARIVALGAECAGAPFERRGLNPLADLKTIRTLTALFSAWRPDVVMGYTPKPSIYASLAAARAGVPRIVPMVTGLGYAFLPGGGVKARIARIASRRLYARALRSANGVIFHNQDDHALISSLVPAHLPVTIVNGSGVDLEQFPVQPLPPVKDGLTFLMIARLTRYKGVAEFVNAARTVKQTAPHARFLLVGPEEHGAGAYPTSELERNADAVTWLGNAEDVRPHLAACHVFVLPSYGEGLPRTVIEAMATGRPIVTTDTPGCRATVRDGANGCLVPAQNADALAAAMLSLLKRPDRIPRMAQESRKLAEELFDVRLVNRAMLGALGLAA